MLNLDIKANKKENKKLALALGEDSRSFLSVVRSLGRANYVVHVVCYDRKSISLKSKYIRLAYYYNYQSYSPDEWLANVLALIERYQYDLIFPCDERAIYPLWQAKKQVNCHSNLAIANQAALDVLFDKWKTKQLAQKFAIPVAFGKLISLEAKTYYQIKQEFSDKFVIKPLQSFTSDSLSKRQSVAIIHNENDYTSFSAANPKKTQYLIEDYFEGSGEGLSVFAWKGEVKAALSYERLAEPHSGGGSSYRQSNELDAQQLLATKAMCQAIELSGIAMFEFRRNASNGKWILVEVNLRPWGGMPLAEFAGIDFPRLFAEHLTSESSKLAAPPNYRKVRARALLTDLYEIKRESEIKAQQSSQLKASLHLLSRTANILRILSPRESIDSLRKDDIAPFLSEINMIFRDIFSQTFNKNVLITAIRRRQIRKKLKRELAKDIKRKVVFVCFGNIIRSPFAEAYLNKIAPNIDTDSFGVHKKEGRKSPNIAIEAADFLDCQLHTHRSKWLSQSDIKESDIFFYFDEKNKSILSAYYQTHHAYNLADLLDNQFPTLVEIDDPYETNVEKIHACYLIIQNALDNLAKLQEGVAL